MAKVIVVFGATGMQGGSVMRALLKDGKFMVRGVTRNKASDKAKALQTTGVDVVEGSLDDSASLSKALAGAYGVFGMTNYWELFDKNKEIKQGQSLVDACKAAGVKHLIYSGLESVQAKIGKDCPHFEGKAEIVKYMFGSGVPSTCVKYSGYMENIGGQYKDLVHKDETGAFVIGLPMDGKPMHMICTQDAGAAVAAIFNSPDEYIGKSVGLSGDYKTVKEIADILSKHLAPKTFKAGDITVDQFAKLGFPGADDLAAMFDFYARGNPDYDVTLTKQLDPSTPNLEDWVKANKEKLDAFYV